MLKHLLLKIALLERRDSEDAPKYAVLAIDSTSNHHGVTERETGRIKPKGLPAEQVHRFVQDMNAGHYATENQVKL